MEGAYFGCQAEWIDESLFAIDEVPSSRMPDHDARADRKSLVPNEKPPDRSEGFSRKIGPVYCTTRRSVQRWPSTVTFTT